MADAPGQRMYKIGEVCRLADVQPYVLRYWETEFPPLAPNKSGGGQRMYSERDVEIILRIKQLLYAEGFTIAGAKKRLDAEMTNPQAATPRESAAATAAPHAPQRRAKTAGSDGALREIRRELESILDLLRG
ncbi:MAG: MerR family transcriptional regulator [Thermoanaerobaculia bacterium]